MSSEESGDRRLHNIEELINETKEEKNDGGDEGWEDCEENDEGGAGYVRLENEGSDCEEEGKRGTTKDSEEIGNGGLEEVKEKNCRDVVVDIDTSMVDKGGDVDMERISNTIKTIHMEPPAWAKG